MFQLHEVDLFTVHKNAVGALKILNAPTVLGTPEDRMVLGDLFVRQLDVVVSFATNSELGSFERKSKHDLSVIITHQASIHVMLGFQGRFSFPLGQGKKTTNRPVYSRWIYTAQWQRSQAWFGRGQGIILCSVA
jgi:hypothetical protein